MNGKEVVSILQEAVEDAGLTEEQRRRVMACFALAMGKRLQRALDNATFAEIISKEQGQ